MTYRGGAPVFDTGTRMGSQRAEERWGRGGPIRVHGDGRQALWWFRRKTATYPRRRKASTTTSEGTEKDGLVGRQCSRVYRFDGLGLKTITHLLGVGRGPDKTETLKVFEGTWWTSRGYIEAKRHSEVTGAVG